MPNEIVSAWRKVGQRGAGAREEWTARFKSSAKGRELEAALDSANVETAIGALGVHAAKVAADKPNIATRAASGAAIDAMFAILPELLGGSADLTPSNNTLAKGAADLNADAPDGRYIRYGIREHAMGAAMNGLALHGGVIPYAGTFMTFSDYSRPAIRLAALMGIRVIHVLTHDSIGLGEDGPTHQPVEHLAALRAMPNLFVVSPSRRAGKRSSAGRSPCCVRKARALWRCRVKPRLRCGRMPRRTRARAAPTSCCLRKAAQRVWRSFPRARRSRSPSRRGKR